VLALCGMEEGAEPHQYQGGSYKFAFQDGFEFMGKQYSFHPNASLNKHQFCALLYVFRDNVQKKNALLKNVSVEKLALTSSNQNTPSNYDARLKLPKGFERAYKLFQQGVQGSSVYFNLTKLECSLMDHYCDAQYELILVQALKGKAHISPNNTQISASGHKSSGALSFSSSAKSEKSVVHRRSQSFFSTLFSFFTKRPVISVGLLFGGFLLYHAKYHTAVKVG